MENEEALLWWDDGGDSKPPTSILPFVNTEHPAISLEIAKGTHNSKGNQANAVSVVYQQNFHSLHVFKIDCIFICLILGFYHYLF
jgi:hypothetical protein